MLAVGGSLPSNPFVDRSRANGMRALLLIVLFVSLAACSQQRPQAWTRPNAITDEQIRAESKVWLDCAIGKTRELDDRHSDAATVALGVRSACHSYYNAAPREELSTATQVVLRVRSWDRENDGEAAARMEAWANCVFGKINEFDDRISAPEIIAVAIVPQCHSLYSGNKADETPTVLAGITKVRNQVSRGPVYSPSAPQPAIYNRI